MRVIRIYDELSAFPPEVDLSLTDNSVKFIQEVVKSLPFKVIAMHTNNGMEFTYIPFKKDTPCY